MKDFLMIMGGQSTLCTVGQCGGQSTKDLKDHLKTTHSQLEVFRPCFLKINSAQWASTGVRPSSLIVKFEKNEKLDKLL